MGGRAGTPAVSLVGSDILSSRSADSLIGTAHLVTTKRIYRPNMALAAQEGERQSRQCQQLRI
jgi:hypothetical protein